MPSVSSARFMTPPLTTRARTARCVVGTTGRKDTPTDAGHAGSRATGLVASWNIAKDGARRVPADSWQMKRAAEEPVAPVKLPVDPERFPKFSTGI